MLAEVCWPQCCSGPAIGRAKASLALPCRSHSYHRLCLVFPGLGMCRLPLGDYLPSCIHNLLWLHNGRSLQLVCISGWHVLGTQPDYLQHDQPRLSYKQRFGGVRSCSSMRSEVGMDGGGRTERELEQDGPDLNKLSCHKSHKSRSKLNARRQVCDPASGCKSCCRCCTTLYDTVCPCKELGEVGKHLMIKVVEQRFIYLRRQ